MTKADVTFSPSIAIQANDGRTVRFMFCNVCAAVVVHDPLDDGALLERHAEWHETVPLTAISA